MPSRLKMKSRRTPPLRVTTYWAVLITSLRWRVRTSLKLHHKETPQIRVPMGIGFGIFDALCDEVKRKWIPEKLETLKIPFEWTDEEEGLLTVGPITEETESNNLYSIIRQTYYLEVVCDDRAVGGYCTRQGTRITITIVTTGGRQQGIDFVLGKNIRHGPTPIATVHTSTVWVCSRKSLQYRQL